MKYSRIFVLSILCICLIFLNKTQVRAQFTNVGSGSYTNVFPGVDEAGRNGFPSGTPQLSGSVLDKPVPTNDWWSKLIKEDHADNLFNYPMTMKTTNDGLIVTYIPWGVIGDSAPIKVGLSGLNTTKTTVSDYSDWTVTMHWDDGSHDLQATTGIAMPFLYFQKEADDILEITINSGTVSISGEMLIIENATNNADFVFYAPAGSSWTQNGNIYTSTLNGKNYWSMAMLPISTTNVSTVAEEYKDYAYVFPTNTTANWAFNETTSTVRTDFTVTTEVKEGTNTNMLIGLLPHQWDNLAADSPIPDKLSYEGVRGEIKTMAGNTFSVENTFSGILPTMPYLATSSDGFSAAELANKISLIENDELSDWTDSYNEGQVMNRLIQSARIADQTGDIEARDKMIATVKERLEDWLTAEASEVAFIFYYNDDWSAMLGYPAGHGQDNNINDHHFHWGYFIHAAAFMEQFEPGWADEWGEMVNLLVRDAASSNRDDELFPFLRNFSPYGGHCWANGFATFPQGNDQESTSESMQFNSSLIHWGSITGNTEIRDLGIYLYTTEQTAIEEYWFDMYERNFQSGQQYGLVSRVWGNSYDNGTFWTSDITASYVIELYPMHGGSLYLGQNLDYVEKIWNELQSNTGILSTDDTNPNLWHDTIWKYLALLDPERAIELYNSYPDRIMKFGVTDVQTYHWIHAMNAMGSVRSDITADYPIAAAFDKSGSITYVAHNYTDSPITVEFSDGFQLEVPANEMATNRDVDVSGTISSDFDQAYPGGSVNLTVEITEGTTEKVEFFDGSTLIGTDLTAPYEMQASNLSLGIHGLYAKIYEGSNFMVTNSLSIQVGEQIPYSNAHTIPGIIEPGHYDKFEGGKGSGISYQDFSSGNEGDFREDEDVDASQITNEGATIGWISSGEWTEYTIDVAESGKYNLSFRYASGNNNGGGPFHFEIDGNTISPDISVGSTGDWDAWATQTASNIELNQGQHILRLVFDAGEFNLGKMTFERSDALDYVPPVADAGENVVVILPASTAQLDGSASMDPENQPLTYLWEQIYGPSIIGFSDNTLASPSISNLVEGIYKCKLTVNDGEYSATSSVLVIVSETGNTNPSVSISAPIDGASYSQGSTITIEATATDLEGDVVLVEFYDGTTKIGEDNSEPFSFEWNNAGVGAHALTAKATDEDGATGTSEIVNVSVSQVQSCFETSTEAIEGSFSTGYTATFETVGNNVTITFELLDTDKDGVVAFLWQKDPFNETSMDHVSGNTFTRTISGLDQGTTISYACKFAFAGGLAVTKYIDYVVGDSCGSSLDDSADLSDIKIDGVSLNGFSSNTLTYTYTLPTGTTTVPTTTATPENENAIVNITPASAIPGTTSIVVTAEDGITTKTYSVNFILESTSSNANLSDIRIDGVSLNGFSSGTLSYTYTIPTGTTTVPTTTATSEDTNANVNITPASAIPGTTSIVVTAEDGVTNQTYSINFILESTSSDATLSDLQIDGATIDGFLSGTTSYSVQLPLGTTTVPTITATATDSNASISISPANSLPGSTVVTVTAEDGVTTLAYTISFTLADGSSDASLSDLKIDGTTVEGFASDKYSYAIELPSGTTVVPTVTASTTDTNAEMEISAASGFPGITRVFVTAQDGTTTKTYSIQFSVPAITSVESLELDAINVYAYDQQLHVYGNEKFINSRIEVFNLFGKIIVNDTMSSPEAHYNLGNEGFIVLRIWDQKNNLILTRKLIGNYK